MERLRFLCEYLAQEGWEIDLYTEQYESIPFAHTYPIHEVKVYRTRSLAEWILKSVWSLLTDWRNRYFSRKVRKAIEGKNYDLVLCCTFSTFPLRAAWDIANERNIPLHVDLRDLDEQVHGTELPTSDVGTVFFVVLHLYHRYLLGIQSIYHPSYTVHHPPSTMVSMPSSSIGLR